MLIHSQCNSKPVHMFISIHVLCQGSCHTILALSVFPAPDSPLIRMACFCSSIIIKLNACERHTDIRLDRCCY